MKDYELPKQIRYVAINSGEAVYLYSLEEAFSYQMKGYLILEWKPLELERQIVIVRR